MNTNIAHLEHEWLEADGLGGFASGTVAGYRTRRYHALLLAATNPPAGRVALVNGLEVWVEANGVRAALSAQRYAPDVTHPDGHTRLERFSHEPWPRWVYRLDDGSRVTQEVIACHGAPQTLVRWSYDGAGAATLKARPLLSGRDYHALHRENPAFSFDADRRGSVVSWRPYAGLPRISALTNGDYEHRPDWYRNFVYDEERRRGLDCVEDLASPGVFSWDLARGEAVLVLSADETGFEAPAGLDAIAKARDSAAGKRGRLARPGRDAAAWARELADGETKRRKRLGTPLQRAADAYIVRRGAGKTIVAGYPWFTDWGRDTFIALRGLCIAAGRLDVAEDILTAWAGAISEGMAPNRFPDAGETPEYNAVDASLWYVVAAHEFGEACARASQRVSKETADVLRRAVLAIVSGYAAGTRFGIRMDADGLLAAGAPGVQLTWMDAKVGDWVVTPRIGKPVEVQALWINALRIAGAFEPKWLDAHDRALAAFRRRFWNAEAGFLYDVVDVDHVAGAVDAALRPNQLFAVGGLPFSLLAGERARKVVEVVEAKLMTPLGPRSLAPGEPGYRERYEGGVWERDSAYHQGTVWPWLIGPFVEAWLRVRGATDEAKAEARGRFVQPLLDHLDAAGLGHVSEITDAEAPHAPRGCPFQAWSLGELLRVLALVGDAGPTRTRKTRTAAPRAAGPVS